MSLSAGARLGPYEILAPIGAGGMGEVYRASDPRLGRDVAIKIISTGFAADPDRIHRFELEARAAAALNHPNILAVHDIGTHNGVPYIVSELLDGQTLRRVLAGGAVSQRNVIDYGIQICQGLAAAHEKGMVHRDLKPDNVFVTVDGRIKILDFGLTKLTEAAPAATAVSMLPTRVQDTAPGIVLGTVGYMSPEQVRGQTVDHRSDIFSLGAMLFEMVSGKRAFGGETPADTISAVLSKDPTNLSAEWKEGVHPLLDETVRHCLEKNPAERFQSASDVAFSLGASRFSSSSAVLATVAPARKKSTPLRTAAGAAVLAAIALIGWLNRAALARAVAAPPPAYLQLTFRRGIVEGAAFAPDGQTIVYAAAWDGQPLAVYSTRLDSPESRELGITNADVVGTTPGGEMFLRLDILRQPPFISIGTLARASIAGAAPRPLVDNVLGASAGKQIAVVRRVDGSYRLEFPIGHVIHQSLTWVSDPRVSPDGSSVAVVEHPTAGDDGDVVLFDAGGKKHRLSAGWSSVHGVAWSPDGREVWFTASKGGMVRSLRAVDLTGRERLVYGSPADLQLQDIARDGRVLVTTASRRAEVRGLLDGDREERTLSPFDWATGPTLSPDGRAATFDESGEGSRGATSYVIRSGEATPTRIVENTWISRMSPDRRWVIGVTDNRDMLRIVPVGPGDARTLPPGGVGLIVGRPEWMPDSKRVMFTGLRTGEAKPQTYVQSVDGGAPDPLPVTGTRLSHDGRRLVLAGAGPVTVYDLVSKQRTALPESDGLAVVGWSPDSTAVYAVARNEIPVAVFAIDTASGRRRLLMRIAPADRTGVIGYALTDIVKDGAAYVVAVTRTQSDLHVISGLR
jgi:Tol biopolymer transport system component